MSEFLAEIKDDIRKERYLSIWRSYGKFIIAVAVVAVATGGSYGIWKKYKEQYHTKSTAEIANAILLQASRQNDEAIEQFTKAAENSDKNLATIALMHKAALLQKNGKAQESTQIYKTISDDKQAPLEYKDMAALLYCHNILNRKETSPSQETEAAVIKLKELTQSKSPWQGLALEMLGAYYLNAGDKNSAKAEFTKITSDVKLSNKLRQRATEMLDLLGK